MGIYDGLPYELQSPTFRNASNRNKGKTGWNPTINQDFATSLIDAQVALAQANATRGVNTSQIDGQTPFVEQLVGFGGALLQSIGVRPDAGSQPQPMVQQAAFGRSSDGMDTRTMLMFGGAALAAYLIWGR